MGSLPIQCCRYHAAVPKSGMRLYRRMGNTSDPHGEGRHEWLADEPVPTRFQRESLVLMAQRMQLGLALYPLIWAELTLIDGQAWRHTGFAWAHGLTLALISVTRFVYHRHLLKHMPEDVTRTRRVFCGLSLAHNLYWGLLCARIFGIGAPDTLSWMMLVATVGITAGGTVITASDPVLPRIYAFATLGPTALVLLPQGGWTNISITGMSFCWCCIRATWPASRGETTAPAFTPRPNWSSARWSSKR
jgi:hypothetical protein